MAKKVLDYLVNYETNQTNECVLMKSLTNQQN